ncbi:hypothetical protein [Burkholderia gladioli]|uniref:hypothetical protein n=1 Tax=Burkholderia gladioli TaxID=28095 RepID=UPI000F547937|nr:hypothetical protein [Burkholderia gladioli]
MKVDQSEKKSVQHDALAELIEQFLPQYLNQAARRGRDTVRDELWPVRIVPDHDRRAANAAMMHPRCGRRPPVHSALAAMPKIARNLLVFASFCAKFFSSDLAKRNAAEPFTAWLSGVFLFLRSLCQIEHHPIAVASRGLTPFGAEFGTAPTERFAGYLARPAAASISSVSQ